MRHGLLGSLARALVPAGARTVVAELRFGNDLTRETVEGFLAAMSGLPRRAVVVLQLLSTDSGVRHLVRGDQATIDVLHSQLRALAPSARLSSGAEQATAPWNVGARVSWSGRHPLLRVDGAAQSAAGLLAAIGQLGASEAVLVQLTLRPGQPAPVERQGRGHDASKAPSLLTQLLFGAPVAGHDAGAVRAKQAGPLLRSGVVVAVAASNRGRAAHLLSRSVGVFRARRGARGQFMVRVLGPAATARALSRPRAGGLLLSPAEASGLTGFPIDAPRLAGVALGNAPLLMPDRRIPTTGRVLAHSNWPGMEGRPLAQPVVGALSHGLLSGPTGSGKSWCVAALMASDMAAGHGCLLVDGKGDLVEDVLARVPPGRIKDVIVLDPAAGGPVPGLRVFGHGTDPELAADLVLGVLRDLFRDSWGVRSDQWLRAGLVTIAHDPQATLGDLPYVFTDEPYRRRLLGRINDPLLLATWAAFDAMHPREQANQLGAPLNKLSELLGRRVLRTVLSQTKPGLEIAEAIRNERIVLVSLSPGRLGSPAARLLGALVVYQLYAAVQARAALPPTKRTPFLAYIDEPGMLGDLPVPLDRMFELARGLGVGLTLAVQSVTQLPTPVRNAALTNAASFVVFRQNAEDAELLARYLPGTDADGLKELGAFEVVARIGLGPGEIAAPASGRTLPPPPPISDPAAVRQASAERYGADPASVDRALAERHGQLGDASHSDEETPIGRRRRSP
jgi:hypothetical protein